MSDSTTQETGQQQEQAAPDAAKLAADLAAATAKLAEFEAWKAEQVKASEEAARAKMSDAQKLEADRAALAAKEKALKDRSRKEALAKLGVIEKAHQWAPDVDPADPAGAKALEDWAKANPELVKAPETQGHSYAAEPRSALGQILSGEKKSPLMSGKWARRLLGGGN